MHLVAPPAELPEWAKRTINLADTRLGAEALFASDDFFAPVSRMLDTAPAVFVPGRFDDHGKWMDGWESRRKRGPGNDWAIIRLGARGVISGFDIDTSHFNGNQPLAGSIDACCAAPAAKVEELECADWREILPQTALGPNQHHLLRIEDDRTWTHLRVQIYPDGGIARLRVYGRALGPLSPPQPGALIDLVGMENGGSAISWNDASFGSAVTNLLLPKPGIDMGDGWETRRRREPGHDWCVLALGVPGVIKRVDVDTRFYKGNYPDRCALQGKRILGGAADNVGANNEAWPILLPEQKLQMDTLQSFTDQVNDLGPVTHVRFNIFPDGGVSRLRLWGHPA